jgi:hypothetical protein
MRRKRKIIKRITDRNLSWYAELSRMYPAIAALGRPAYTSQEKDGYASIESYMLGELASYSYRTLNIYEEYQEKLFCKGKSIPQITLENTMKKQGFSSLKEAERGGGTRRVRKGEI